MFGGKYCEVLEEQKDEVIIFAILFFLGQGFVLSQIDQPTAEKSILQRYSKSISSSPCLQAHQQMGRARDLKFRVSHATQYHIWTYV